jgi:hypothetical protein
MTFAPLFRRQAFLEFCAAKHWYEKQRSGLGSQFQAEIDRPLARACRSPLRFAEVLSPVRQIRVRRFPFSHLLQGARHEPDCAHGVSFAARSHDLAEAHVVRDSCRECGRTINALQV